MVQNTTSHAPEGCCDNPYTPPAAAPPWPWGDALHVEGLRLWARVGVLPEERSMGQWFALDLTVWLDLAPVGRSDDLRQGVDYSAGIAAVRDLAEQLVCHTIEHFGECILDRLTDLYGERTMRLRLRKCHPPIPGFSGSVSVERWRFAACCGGQQGPLGTQEQGQRIG